MKIELKKVEVDEKEILRNLLEKYYYEFSQWDNKDVNKLGLFGFNYLDSYWVENNRFPFFILADDNLAGFVLVNDYSQIEEKTDYTLADFFVMFKYRRSGVGRIAVNKVFDMFHGKWTLKKHPHNIKSGHFWDSVVNEYTGGNYRLIKSYPNTEYEDGTCGDIYLFEN